jgi:transglutaminase-like putative cysteine protease
MYYSITHRTRYKYSAPVSESISEVRMNPRSDGNQRCLRFELAVSPQARTYKYVEASGNIVHYFDIPGRHSQLAITAEAIVEVHAPPKLPDRLPNEAWGEIDMLARTTDAYDMLLPGELTTPSEHLRDFMTTIDARRRDDPLTVILHIKRSIYESFQYVPLSTEVDSHIDDTLSKGEGVCQDFSHIMLAIVRELGVPARYVSGYLFHQGNGGARSTPDATHAWVEVLLPGLGWVGLDPTNNMLGDGRHIRVAVGREYSDVTPTRGVFKGSAESKLMVEVKVDQLAAPPPSEELEAPVSNPWRVEAGDGRQVQQQQQQQ